MSEQLINKRIRNRIIEVLQIISSHEEHEKFSADEIINMWEDWVDDERIGKYIEPVFSKQEQESLVHFHEAWKQTINHTPQIMPDISVLNNNKY